MLAALAVAFLCGVWFGYTSARVNAPFDRARL